MLASTTDLQALPPIGRVSLVSLIFFHIDSGAKGTVCIDVQNTQRWYGSNLERAKLCWEAQMLRLKSVAILLVMAPVCALAQWHSGDSEQGYFQKPSNPILNIDDQATKTWSYPCLSDLMKMKRISVDVPDPKTNQKDSCEGVALKRCIRGYPGLPRQTRHFKR
jgi:hypothetical protein